MSRREFLEWVEFYEETPFDDFHRYHRPAALIAQRMAGGDIQSYLDWLLPPRPNPEMSGADLTTLASFKIKPSTGK